MVLDVFCYNLYFIYLYGFVIFLTEINSNRLSMKSEDTYRKMICADIEVLLGFSYP